MSNVVRNGTKVLFEHPSKEVGWISGEVSCHLPKDDDKNELQYEIVLDNKESERVIASSNELHAMIAAHQFKAVPVAKDFGEELGGIFKGRVMGAFWAQGDSDNEDEILFPIAYEDGDFEDFNETELHEAMELYHEMQQQTATPSPQRSKSKGRIISGRKRKVAGPKTTGLDVTDDEKDESKERQKKSRSRRETKSPSIVEDQNSISSPPSPSSGKQQTSINSFFTAKVKKEPIPKGQRRQTTIQTFSKDDAPTASLDAKEIKKEVKVVSTSRYGRRRRMTPQPYSDADLDRILQDSSSNDESSSEKENRRRPKKKQKVTATRKKKKWNDDSDESSVTYDDTEESEEFLTDTSEEEDDDFEMLDLEDDLPNTKKKTNNRRGAPKPKVTVPAKKEKETGPKKKSMKDSFEPYNRPLYPSLTLKEIKETKQFLDPCGQEATDDIISLLVGEQIDKIQALLQRSLGSGKNLGSTEMPLQLGTACSGTDAPALALTLVQEQLELRGLQSLTFDHKFSCEVEPFKQAYLARNFDSVLYPDICKLTDENPRDAYGQVQPIPEYNLFVAGTSCKNFSMLRANKRLDIEDKGCSGETFLAAVEHMFDQQPPFCILENVQNAPWDKMSEYIEGKIKLSSCAEKKAITGAKKNEVLEFVLKDDKILVDKVPSVFGVRCGSTVAGFSRPGDLKKDVVRPVVWPKSSKTQKCTLEDLVTYNKISKANDTLVFEVPIKYHTAKIKVDTKDFGLPQTRNRMYLFVWRVEDGADLGEYWKLIVEHLKSPVRHSLEAFVLQEDHDIIRVFREALRGPAGRSTKRGNFLEVDYWTSSSANLPHNKNSRAALGVEDRARPITNWGPFGKRQLPPHYWLEFLNCCTQRELDLLDILHASAARDAESHDSSFASFVWNISQNATREKHRSACPGISGCVTPGGEFFLPHLGRPLLGCEKLLLQGIPYFRLALGTETEVQLGDLAGNAMSLTVVGATLLAAICCKQLREEAHSRIKKNSFADVFKDQLSYAKKILEKGVIARDPDLAASQVRASNSNRDGLDFVEELANLADEALDTSIWCTCETSGQNSGSDVFFECSICKISCCQECCGSTSGYQLDSHTVSEKVLPKDKRKLGDFDTKLRNILPPKIIFAKESFSQLLKTEGPGAHNVSLLAHLHFNLHRISRLRRSWRIVYFAREKGVGETLAEIAIQVGELPDNTKGALVELRSFLQARVAPLVYGPLTPIAVWRCNMTRKGRQEWIGAKPNTVYHSLNVIGSLPGKSFRTEVGLTNFAAEAVNGGCKKSNNKKAFAHAKQAGEERRWLYARNWYEWPEELLIDGDDSEDTKGVIGTYVRANCRQTVNQGAVWIRKESPALYLLIQPEVSRTGPDFAVISKSICHDDASSVVATFPAKWQPSDALVKETQKVKAVKFNRWFSIESMKCLIPESNISVSSPKEDEQSDKLLTVHGLSEADTNMLELYANPTNKKQIQLLMASGQKAQQTVRAFNAVCVSKILQHAASVGLAYDLRPEAKWKVILPSNPKVPFGTCSRTFPEKPKELWRRDLERHDWERFYEPGESRAFYQALERRPRAFEFLLDKEAKTLEVKVNPEVVAHYASGHLSRGRGVGVKDTEIDVSVKLCASQFQSDPVVDIFVVPSCHDEEISEVKLKDPYKLYERQKRVVTKMRAIENRETIFNEMEMYEEHMPGSTGWSLIARAQRNARISGGVIADAIGAGKTVISIALILQGLKDARNATGKRQSSATLVVVPSHLITQWKGELDKFTDGLKVLCVYDLKTLLRLKVSELMSSDCVICPVDILESAGYLEHLLKASGSDFEDCPKMPPYAGQKELTGAFGIWIPATSADPYGGANSSHNQKRRNASARYTHVYLNAVKELRAKEFSKDKKGVPLEYFQWERIIVDEIHESLCCTKEELIASNDSKKENEIFKERNRRAGRELLGITTRDPSQRPLVARKAIFGLTGTPLLDSSSRVIELASLIGCTYVLGLASHWRKLERESCRDIFLHYYLEPKQSRVIRRNLYSKCQDYISTACCRNKVGDEMNGIKLQTHTKGIQMTEAEGQLYLKSQSGISPSKKSFAISPEDFDVTAGHDITKFLRQNIDLACRKQKLIEVCKEILEKDETTKIIVFADGRIGGGISARAALNSVKGLGCTWLDETDTTEIRNQKISWYQYGDVTEEDKKRPRILVLHFEHAAGLNLQAECYNLIFFSPLYIGSGGANSDAVSDVSTELQATGRVFRPGQPHPVVNVFRIEVRGPKNEECLDSQLIRRNTDKETLAMAVNASD